MSSKTTTQISLAVLGFCAISQASAAIYVTEWMHSGSDGEFVELTDLGSTAVDFTSYSYDDESRLPGSFDLSGFGVVVAGESVIFTESDATQFRLD